MEIVGSLAGFILLEKAHSVVTSKLHETMMFYNKTTHITHIWDGLQTSVMANICHLHAFLCITVKMRIY